ncbi:MAG: hypothetical protein Q4A66_12505 [Eubacteriales bacterium]|nr:hypothetical protein [Eubacteriales bacterium]
MGKVISRKRQRERRIRLRVAASLMDFFGVIGSVVLIALCVLLLRSLAVWVAEDFDATFSLLKATVLNAVMVGAK